MKQLEEYYADSHHYIYLLINVCTHNTLLFLIVDEIFILLSKISSCALDLILFTHHSSNFPCLLYQFFFSPASIRWHTSILLFFLLKLFRIVIIFLNFFFNLKNETKNKTPDPTSPPGTAPFIYSPLWQNYLLSPILILFFLQLIPARFLPPFLHQNCS